MFDNSKRTRNTCLSLRFTKEEKQQIDDLAKKLNLKLTELILYLIRKEQESNGQKR